MSIQKLFASVIVFTLMVGTTSVASAQVTLDSNCTSLSRNLRLGMSGSDVLILQQVLNKNPLTTVDVAGPGSRGLETEYFGLKTQRAVMKFQEMYKSEVLTPAGLTTGSGYVGTFTRAKILVLCKSSAVASIPALTGVVTSVVPAPTTTTTIAPSSTTPLAAVSSASLTTPASFKSEVPVLMFPSTYTAPRGATVGIVGVGFAPSGNIAHLGNFAIASTTTSSSGRVSFVVPVDVPFGKHELWVSSSKGVTNKTFFVVTDTKFPAPKVATTTPTKGFFGTTVTVTGSGFTPTGNSIRSSYGFIENITSADGKTLQFNVNPPVPSLNPGEDRPDLSLSVPLWFHVVNQNGLSNSFVFNLTI